MYRLGPQTAYAVLNNMKGLPLRSVKFIFQHSEKGHTASRSSMMMEEGSVSTSDKGGGNLIADAAQKKMYERGSKSVPEAVQVALRKRPLRGKLLRRSVLFVLRCSRAVVKKSILR